MAPSSTTSPAVSRAARTPSTICRMLAKYAARDTAGEVVDEGAMTGGHAVRRRLMAGGDDGPAMTYFETSALLIVFVIAGKFLETAAKGKTSDALSALMSLQPATGVLVVEDEEERAWLLAQRDGQAQLSASEAAAQEQVKQGAAATAAVVVDMGSSASTPASRAGAVERTVPLQWIAPGDLIKVYPGAGIPADGVVESGASDVNESMLTGESMPVSKKEGAEVVGATLNMSGLLYVRVQRVGGQSVLSQIVRLVEDAQMAKAPIQAFADKISGIFAPVVLIVAVLTFVIWMALLSTGYVPDEWVPATQSRGLFSLLFSIAVVVIACPCALGLATPTAVMVGTGVGARNGVLIKGGAALETAHKVSAIIFDKTGTLTEGKTTLSHFVLLPRGSGHAYGAAEVLGMLVAAESGSEHPLARAVVEGAHKVLDHMREQGIVAADAQLPHFAVVEDSFAAEPGFGLQCSVVRDADAAASAAEQSLPVLVGNRAWMRRNGVEVTPAAESQLMRCERAGNTAVVLAVDGVAYAVVGIADRVKSEAAEVVRALAAMDVEVWMVTGDNHRT
ncbi:heavy metal translocating P-type ATPase, partial [archaeon]